MQTTKKESNAAVARSLVTSTAQKTPDQTELLREIRKQMELPEIVIESKEDRKGSLTRQEKMDTANMNSNYTSPVSLSTPTSPRFVVSPVASWTKTEDSDHSLSQHRKMDMKSSSTPSDPETSEKQGMDPGNSDETAENLTEGVTVECNITATGEVTGSQPSKDFAEKPYKDSDFAGQMRAEQKSDEENSEFRKKSESHSFTSHGSLPKSRKVSFVDDSHSEGGVSTRSDRLHPGYLIIPHPPSRRISSESFYGYPPSRKSSLDAFYCQPPVPHHKVSVYSMQSTDSDRTFRDTHEALPHPDHYRELADLYDPRRRPTLFELRDLDKLSEPQSPGSVQSDLFAHELMGDEESTEKVSENKPAVSPGLKFGWIQGVLVRCLLNIFGVMLFLRLTWVTGQAGVGLVSVVILLSAFVTTLTTMSMSAICTNGEVKGGGAYYMISRSLGPEFGGSIGVIFSLANAVAAAMYVVGFAETVRDLMWEHGVTITGDMLHEVRIIGAVTCCLCLAIVLIGMEWEAKAQLVLLLILSVAIVNFLVGTFIPPSDEESWKGVVGYKGSVFSENFGPSFTEGNNFFSVFSIFFPAATGILAGANISGDLKDPQKAIPKGTFLAILITAIVYLAMAWAAGGCIVREALGPLASSTIVNITGNMTTIKIAPTLEVITDCSKLEEGCQYGLLHDNGAAGVASAFKPLILAGIFSATLSSALASIVGAPKVFQALGKDRLFPFIHYFAKGHGKHQEPRRGYLLAFFICVAMTCVGSLDLIAPIISNFFLMAYALINYSCFDASLANSPGFRPAFRYYNKWFSLLGALLCLAAMFLINWWAALITFVIVVFLYMFIKTKKPDVNWGSSGQANAYREALKTSLKLTNVDEHVKNFRPQILVLTGFPRNRAALVDFAAAITKRQSLLICGHVFQGELSEHLKRLRSTAAYRWFKTRKVKSFYNSVAAPTFRIGVQVLLQALGLGKMRPNTLFIGFKSDWQKSDPRDVYDYYSIIQDAFDLHYGVGILRVPEGFDRNKVPDELLDVPDADFNGSDEEEYFSEDDNVKESERKPDKNEANTTTSSSTTTEDKKSEATEPSRPAVRRSGAANHSSYVTSGTRHLRRLNTLVEGQENAGYDTEHEAGTTSGSGPKPTLSPSISVSPESCRRFQEVQYSSIDVWWLFDDGGLTLLVPYILSQRKQWKNCKLRVFCVGTKKGNINEDQVRMASLLSKFRIDYSQLTVIPDLSKKPQLSTYREFESLIHKWRLRTGEYQEDYLWKIADSDLIAYKQKTYRNLRLREQLLLHSTEASLIVMTLPVPLKSMCPAGLYLGWLEMLTRDLPPVLLLRGNQQSVLTYYS